MLAGRTIEYASLVKLLSEETARAVQHFPAASDQPDGYGAAHQPRTCRFAGICHSGDGRCRAGSEQSRIRHKNGQAR